ncbi:hypothetical protein CXG81DRAFT_26672 [Caulochytrium protostelioides]|uniref:Uncharacterized protein n=1 Tax=Caulochytrium protostelioides TaxID=1555241 RepID=A0A4P9X6I8_9FUNG|nr:hypothetical protein CXG81DRAFT_26672 [Caulochytrium protostelioides]|eukprot:RKP00611.1 hypothetical protein CXG81DRAFT_26672 [Caulochytrium protostelioides]
MGHSASKTAKAASTAAAATPPTRVLPRVITPRAAAPAPAAAPSPAAAAPVPPPPASAPAPAMAPTVDARTTTVTAADVAHGRAGATSTPPAAPTVVRPRPERPAIGMPMPAPRRPGRPGHEPATAPDAAALQGGEQEFAQLQANFLQMQYRIESHDVDRGHRHQMDAAIQLLHRRAERQDEDAQEDAAAFYHEAAPRRRRLNVEQLEDLCRDHRSQQRGGQDLAVLADQYGIPPAALSTLFHYVNVPEVTTDPLTQRAQAVWVEDIVTLRRQEASQMDDSLKPKSSARIEPI